MTNDALMQYLKRGEGYGEYLNKRRSFLEKEVVGIGKNCIEGEQSVQIRKQVSLDAEIEDLTTAEYSYNIVMGALWHLEPEDRDLLMDFYSKRRTPHAIAADLDISESTFWRRRRRAMQCLRQFLHVS